MVVIYNRKPVFTKNGHAFVATSDADTLLADGIRGLGIALSPVRSAYPARVTNMAIPTAFRRLF